MTTTVSDIQDIGTCYLKDLPIGERVRKLHAINKDMDALIRQYRGCKQRCADIRGAILKQITGVTFNDQIPDDDEQFCAFIQTSLHANRAYIDAYSECTILQLRIENLEMERRELLDTDTEGVCHRLSHVS